jgi:hypothetical protein
MSSRKEDLEARIVVLVLAIATAVSVADAVWGFLGMETWAFPLIFLALLISLRWLGATRSKIESIAMGTPLRVYDSYAEFYGEAWHSISRSSKTVYAVFSHSQSPAQHTAESRRYYSGTIKWARKDPGERSLHRVIRLPARSPDVQEWVDEQVKLAEQIENYHVRVLRYPEGMEMEGENFAVIDSTTVYLGFEMDTREVLKGFSIRDSRVARAFEEHFQELWRIASKQPIPSQAHSDVS